MEKFDVLVCGAGCAGFCAAVAAARNGAKVALVEKYNTPGGIMTILGSNSVDQFNNPFKADHKMVIKGIGWELMLRLEKDGFCRIPDQNAVWENHMQYGIKVNPAACAKVMDDMLLEAGVRLFYGQQMVDAQVENGRIVSVSIATRSGLKQLAADVFVDATGEAELATFSGARVICGDGKGTFQPGTLRYYPAVTPAEGDKVLNHGDNKNHVKLNTTDSDAVTMAEIEARRMIYDQMLAGDPIMAIAPAVAPREGRRVVGLSQQNSDDYYNGVVFEDSVCYSYWFIDIHRDGQPAYIKYIKHPNTPTLRLSGMISADIPNLMMAGRCISTDRETNSSLRVKGSCMAIGEAAGTAAALAALDKTDPAALPIDKVKRTLAEHGAIVPGICAGEEWVPTVL